MWNLYLNPSFSPLTVHEIQLLESMWCFDFHVFPPCLTKLSASACQGQICIWWSLLRYSSEMCPSCAAYYGNRAATYMMLSQYAKALEDARQAVSLNPKFVKVRLMSPLCGVQLVMVPSSCFRAICGRPNACSPWVKWLLPLMPTTPHSP